MTTEKEIQSLYGMVQALISEYERSNKVVTIDGFSLWLMRRERFELSQHREELKERVISAAGVKQ